MVEEAIWVLMDLKAVMLSIRMCRVFGASLDARWRRRGMVEGAGGTP